MNSSICRVAVFFVALLCLSVEPTLAVDLPKGEVAGPIKEAVARAAKNGSKINGQKLGGATVPEEIPAGDPLGAWQFELLAYYSENEAKYGYLTTIRRTAIIQNHGTYLEFMTSTESVPAGVADGVRSRMDKGAQEVINAHENLQTTITYEDGRFWIRSLYDFSHGTGWNDIAKPLDKVMSETQDLISQVYFLEWDEGKKYRKRLEKATYETITADEFGALIDRNFNSEDVIANASSANGEWWFSNEGFKKVIVNRGTTMELGVAVAVPESWQDEQRAAYLAFAEKELKKPGRASGLVIQWYADNPDFLQALAVFEIGGKKGKDILKSYDSCDEFVEKSSEKLTRHLADMAKESLKAEVTSLDAQQFMALVDDGLEEFTLLEGTPTGHWNFTYSDIDFDLFNYGDRMTFGFSFPFPDGMTEAQKEELLLKAQEKADKKRPKSMDSVTAGYYFKNTDYLFVRGDLAYGRSGEDIHKAYHKFLYDYAEKAAERVGKLLD